MVTHTSLLITLLTATGLNALQVGRFLKSTTAAKDILSIRGGMQFSATTSEQSKSGLGWDSHKAIESIPDTLVKTIDGNDSMRRKFELLCRTAQVYLFLLLLALGRSEYRNKIFSITFNII
jgi:hypothetical protein